MRKYGFHLKIIQKRSPVGIFKEVTTIFEISTIPKALELYEISEIAFKDYRFDSFLHDIKDDINKISEYSRFQVFTNFKTIAKEKKEKEDFESLQQAMYDFRR